MPSSLMQMASANPARSGTLLRFHLAEETSVTVQVLDPAGRIVRTLLDGGLHPAGDHTMSWDGRNDAGRDEAY